VSALGRNNGASRWLWLIVGGLLVATACGARSRRAQPSTASPSAAKVSRDQAAATDAALPVEPQPEPLSPPSFAKREAASDDDEAQLVLTMPSDTGGYGRVELRRARGPAPVACDGGELDRTINAQEDGSDADVEALVGRTEALERSWVACAYRANGKRAAAQAHWRGKRHTPWFYARELTREKAVSFDPTEPLDADVTAVALVTAPAGDERAPQSAAALCAQGTVRRELPREAFDALAEVGGGHSVQLGIDLDLDLDTSTCGKVLVGACVRNRTPASRSWICVHRALSKCSRRHPVR